MSKLKLLHRLHLPTRSRRPHRPTRSRRSHPQPLLPQEVAQRVVIQTCRLFLLLVRKGVTLLSLLCHVAPASRIPRPLHLVVSACSWF